MILKRANVEIVEDNAEKIMELKSAGFVVISGDEPAPAPADEKALEDLTVKELRKLAKARGLELSKTLKKQDLIDILEADDDRVTEAETASEAQDTHE